MKKGNYNEKDLLNKNYAIISYDYEDSCYYLESLHKEKEKAMKRCNYLVLKEAKLMAQPGGWYPIDYMMVDIKSEKIRKCFNYENEALEGV